MGRMAARGFYHLEDEKEGFGEGERVEEGLSNGEDDEEGLGEGEDGGEEGLRGWRMMKRVLARERM